MQKGVNPIDPPPPPPPHVKMPNFTAEKTCLEPGAKYYFDLYS